MNYQTYYRGLHYPQPPYGQNNFVKTGFNDVHEGSNMTTQKAFLPHNLNKVPNPSIIKQKDIRQHHDSNIEKAINALRYLDRNGINEEGMYQTITC
jgi:hypothetical protein